MTEKVQLFLNDLDRAMVELDVNTLDNMMCEDAVLQHITGYLQPKKEWLEQVAVDNFNYREVYSENLDVTIIDEKIEVDYDWTIIGNNKWEFRNTFTLVEVDGDLKWTGRNYLRFR